MVRIVSTVVVTSCLLGHGAVARLEWHRIPAQFSAADSTSTRPTTRHEETKATIVGLAAFAALAGATVYVILTNQDHSVREACSNPGCNVPNLGP